MLPSQSTIPYFAISVTLLATTGKKERAATFSPFSNVAITVVEEETTSPTKKGADARVGEPNEKEKEAKEGAKGEENVDYVVHADGLDDNDEEEDFEMVIKRLEDTATEQKQHIEMLQQQVTELKERNGHLVIKMVENQVGGGGGGGPVEGGTSTPPPSCAGVDLFERMIKMSSELNMEKLGNR